MAQLFITENAFHKLHSLGGVMPTENTGGSVELSPSITPNTNTRRLRIKVKGGGCSGYRYEYSTDDTYGENDLVFEKGNAGVVIDKISINFLDGVTLDYVVELGGEFFQINNPKALNKCGCGSSFSL